MQIKFKINGHNWRIKTVNTDEMREQRADGDFAGLCVPKDRMIFIDDDNVDFETVSHEMFHAYFNYLHLDDTIDLSINNFEEIMASWFCSNADEVIKKAKQLTKALQKGE